MTPRDRPAVIRVVPVEGIHCAVPERLSVIRPSRHVGGFTRRCVTFRELSLPMSTTPVAVGNSRHSTVPPSETPFVQGLGGEGSTPSKDGERPGVKGADTLPVLAQ